MERNNNQSTSNRDGPLFFRSEPRSNSTTSSEFVLQWGNRKRLRCMKIQTNKDSTSGYGRPVTWVNRQVIRSDPSKDPNWINNNNAAEKGNGNGNLRQRLPSPSHRILRNSESWIGMRGHSNGVKGLTSPDRGGDKIKVNNNSSSNHHNNKNSNINGNHQNDHHLHGGGVGGSSGSSETAHEGKKGGASAGSEPIPVVWPPKFVIALTNKEKEEDFMAIKGSKLPQRPKKRAKMIQRTINLVCPGAWLCDLTLERYEVREKKVTKKRPRGLKAMGNINMESDSE